MNGISAVVVSHGHATQLAAVEAPAELDSVAERFDSVAESGFIPLPNAELIAPNEEMNLVRVQLPRSTMISLGFAVNEESAGEQVEADVMLGADGVARYFTVVEDCATAARIRATGK